MQRRSRHAQQLEHLRAADEAGRHFCAIHRVMTHKAT
jgi:hypothetical protein